MNDWYYFFNGVDDNLATSAYGIFEEQSKTEIFDWFSREDVAKEQKEDFIQALVEFKDDCGDFYHYRAYLLAAEALNYFKDYSRGDAIALQILKWSYSFFRQDKQDWQIVPQPLVEAARVALETTDRQRVISAFVHLVHTTQSRHILHIAAEKLGKLDPGNKSAIAALVLLLEVTPNDFNLWNITHSLMKIDPDNPAVISTLVKLIAANTDGWSNLYRRHWHTIEYAIETLAKVGIGNKIAINALVQLTQTTTDKNDIIYAVKNLGVIARGNEIAINALIELMQTTENKYICLYAVISLGEIALGNQTAIAALTEFLQINQGDRLWVSAAKALWHIDKGNVNAISALIQIVANTNDRFILSQSADYLLEIDPINTDMIFTLIERMAIIDKYVFCEAAASLLKFDPNNELAISTLLQILQNEDHLGYRLTAADSLLRIDPSNQIAIDNLFALVQNLGQSSSDLEYLKYVAWSATQSLERIDPSHQLTIAALVNLLNISENKNYSYFNIAVRDLGSFAAGNKDAIAALTKLIDSTEDNYLLLDVAHSLGKIEPGNQKALSTLIEFIQTVDELHNTEIYDPEYEQSCRNNQQLDAADKLQKILLINQMPQVVVALKDYLSKSNWDSSYRYEACYRVIWHCAQNMTYPNFLQAWYKLP